MIERKGHSQIEMIEMFEKIKKSSKTPIVAIWTTFVTKHMIKVLNSIKLGQYPSQRCKITAETQKRLCIA